MNENYYLYPLIFVIFVFLGNAVLFLISIIMLVFKKKKGKLLYISTTIIIMSILYAISGVCSINILKKSIKYAEEKLIVSDIEHYENLINKDMIATDSLVKLRKNSSIELLNLIWEKCQKLETSYFLDYLSQIEFSNLDDFEFSLISAMKDYNIAYDPMYRGAPLEAIKQLNKLFDIYDFDTIKKYVDLDVRAQIRSIEAILILKKDYKKTNHIYFGRLNNSTPISFQLLDKIGDDYLLLQESVFDCNFDSEEIYKDGKFILKDNEFIKSCFEIEDNFIKDIFVLSESDYNKYKKSSIQTRKYLDLELNEKKIDKVDTFRYTESYPCEISEEYNDIGKHTIYWVFNDVDKSMNRMFAGRKFVDANKNQKAGVRLAIIVNGSGE